MTCKSAACRRRFRPLTDTCSAKNAFALSKVLSESIIRSYVETSLDSSLFQFEHQDSKTEPDLAALHALKPADMICQLWQRYTSTAMVPLASSAQAIRREMTTYNQHNVVRMEDKVNAVVQKSIDSGSEQDQVVAVPG